MTQLLEQDIVQMHKEWIYCLDCGLLTEPWLPGKKKTTICNICKQVYTQTSHPWLKKMLALHLSNPKIKRFSAEKVFMCRKCGNYFFQPGKQLRDVCKWCNMLKPSNGADIQTARCTICNNMFVPKYNTRRLICKDCVKTLENLQTALKYTLQVANKARKIKPRTFVKGPDDE